MPHDKTYTLTITEAEMWAITDALATMTGYEEDGKFHPIPKFMKEASSKETYYSVWRQIDEQEAQ